MLFLYKPDFKFQKAEIEKKVCLSAGEFEEFLRNPLEGLPCIEENIDLMQEDRDGIYHCLLVTGEGRRDGVLVESEDQKQRAMITPATPPMCRMPPPWNMIPCRSSGQGCPGWRTK